jgi:hypothetical protein
MKNRIISLFCESTKMSEGIEPKKPSGGVRKKRVIKNRGMVTQKELEQVQFITKEGNDVKVQFQVNDGVGDVVFYVNDTLDDYGGREDGSVDPEIMSGVLWIIDTYADRMGLKVLTFRAWSGKGDTKIVRGLEVAEVAKVAEGVISDYIERVRSYDAKVIPPSERRIEFAKKFGRELVVLYDVNVGKLVSILNDMMKELKGGNIVTTYFFEEEIYLTREGNVKLEDKIPGAMDTLEKVKMYNMAKESHTEVGAVVTKNRRQGLYKRLIDKFFSNKWSVKQTRDSFELTRK